MAVGMDQLTGDLAAETAVLRALLDRLDPAGWELPTPAEGWSVRDQVSHLAYFDDAAVHSATDPDGFRAELARMLETGALSPDDIAAGYRSMPWPELSDWFDASRSHLITTFAGLDGGTKVPWYGPPMSVASALTARLMETWAHGQDIADAVGVRREPTARLRHIAHIGVRTMGFSFGLHGRPVPESPVRVELTAPDGEVWSWGDADAADRLRGPALDFCLLVTQRRHHLDTALDATGPVAREWISIAQAFAGTPGAGRAPVTSGRPAGG